MFFKFDEKTLKDMIDNQRAREKAAKDAAPKYEYDGHALTFFNGVDGSVLIDSNPPLVKVVEGDKTAPCGDVEVLTPAGWVKKQ